MRARIRVRIPPITNLETAIRVFYEKHEIGTKEIIELFGNIASSTACKLKDIARELQCEENVKTWQSHSVNTKCAYRAWGLDIEDMDYRLKKLNENKMATSMPVSQVPQNSIQISIADEIIKLKALLDSGVLTQEEFVVVKKRLLDI